MSQTPQAGRLRANSPWYSDISDESDEIEKIDTPVFGNKWILRWEADRILKRKADEKAGLKIPQAVRSKNEIKGLCIVKLHGPPVGGAITSHGIVRALKKVRNDSLIKR